MKDNISTNFTDILTLQANKQPDAIAIYTAKESISYRVLEDYVWKSATYLRLNNVQEGDVVINSFDDELILIISMLATARIGATLLSVPTNMPSLQLQDIIDKTEASYIISDLDTFSSLTLKYIHINYQILERMDIKIDYGILIQTPKSPWQIIVGSGSTGKSKLIALTHAQENARFDIAKHMNLIHKDDKVASFTSLAYSSIKRRFLETITAGASYVLFEKTTHNYIDVCLSHQITVLFTSVFHIEIILKSLHQSVKNKMGFLKVLSIGTSLVSDDLRERIRNMFTSNLYVNYGINEIGRVTFSSPEQTSSVSQTVGYATGGVIVEIVNEKNQLLEFNQVGHIRVKSPGMIEGYLGDEEATKKAFKDGWFYSGDLGKFTEDGQLIHMGRADRMMIMNGINIYPAEIEVTITKHPAVLDAASMPIKHSIHQDVPVCAVALHDGYQVDKQELINFCIQILSFRSPKEIIILEKIPRNEQGKLLRVELEKQIIGALFAQPRKIIMQKTSNSKKDLLNLRQPTKSYKVNLTLPNIINLELVDAWISQVLEIDEDTSCNGSDMHKLAYKALFIIKNLLQNSQIPAFYMGKVVNIIAEDHNNYAIDLAIVDMNFIRDEHSKKIINFAFKVIFWMMKNEITPQNKQEFYKACLDEIINPITSVQPIGISRMHTLKTAYNKNIPFIHLGDGVYQLGWGSKAKKLDRSISEADSAIGSKLSQNKVNTANLVRLAGLPAPLHRVVNNKENALQAARQLGYPVVVKPSDLDRGEGVSVNITNDTQLIKAFEEAFILSKSKNILVEKQAKGMCHRLFMAQNALLYAVERLPISVKGDGIKTVAQLIDEANHIQNAKAPWLRSKPFPHDDLAYKEIEKCGFSLESVPKKGIWVPLRDIESTKWGGRSENVTEIVHPDNIDIAIRAAKLFGLNIAGIDIITADISQPWHQTGAIINEVNFAPMFGVGETSRSYIPTFFDKFIEEDGRIPLEIFVGEDEETLQKAKRRQRKLIKTGLKCYLSTASQTFDDYHHEIHFLNQNILMRAQALLLNHNVETAIFVVETEGIKEALLERLG